MKNADLSLCSTRSDAPHAAVLGGGAWGTALAAALQRGGYRTRLWCRRPEAARRLNASGRNEAYLPGIELPEGLTATADLAAATRQARLVVMAVPSSALHGVAREAARHLASAVVLVASKGVERDTGALMTEVVARAMPRSPVGVLSGPSFAAGVAGGEPTALTLAIEGVDEMDHPMSLFGDALRQRLHAARIRLELTDDTAGAQIGGALKNVVAIACGLAAGRGLGANSRAAIVSHGMADMLRLTLALGGRPETLLASCGIGDTLLTCTSEQSRNYRFGLRLAQGGGDVAGAADGRLVEGAVNAQTLVALEKRLGLRLHTVGAVRELVQGRISADEALDRVLHGAATGSLPAAGSLPALMARGRQGAAASLADLAS